MTTYYPNKDLTDRALELMRVLGEMPQYEFGWILGGMMHRVTHQDPTYRQEAQRRVDVAIQGILVVYLFSIFDEYTTDEMRGNWMTPEEKAKLGAYRHIRNSVAHGFGGTRAKGCRWRGHFEEKMNSSEPFPGLVWDKSADTIDLASSGIATSCHQFMSKLAKQLAGRLANDNRPAPPPPPSPPQRPASP